MGYPRIGNIQLDGFALLAPMAGVSDLAYRVIARKMGAALTTAEMVSAKGLYYHNEKTKDMLKIAEEEHPVSLQLFGSDPAVMALGAKVMEKAGADIVDINMGCPMQKVVKNGDGSALMKNVPLAEEIISAVAAAVKIPVTVKMRLGWSRDTINAVELAMAAESAGAAAITVHGRTREERGRVLPCTSAGHYGPWSDARRFLCGNGGLERNQKGCECRPYSCHWKRGCGRRPYGKSADRGNRMCGSCYRQSSMGESVGFQGGEYISGNRRDTSCAELGRTACHGKETSAWIMYRKRGADGGQGNAGPCEPIFPWAS